MQNKNFIESNNMQKIHNLNVIYNANTFNYNVGNISSMAGGNNFNKKTTSKKKL